MAPGDFRFGNIGTCSNVNKTEKCDPGNVTRASQNGCGKSTPIDDDESGLNQGLLTGQQPQHSRGKEPKMTGS